MDDARHIAYYLDFLDATNAKIFLQQLSGRPSSLHCAVRFDVLPSSKVRKMRGVKLHCAASFDKAKPSCPKRDYLENFEAYALTKQSHLVQAG